METGCPFSYFCFRLSNDPVMRCGGFEHEKYQTLRGCDAEISHEMSSSGNRQLFLCFETDRERERDRYWYHVDLIGHG